MSSLSTELQTSSTPPASEAEGPVEAATSEARPLNATSAPAWFQNRRQRSAAESKTPTASRQPPAPLPKLDTSPVDEIDERDGMQRAIDWLRDVAAESYGASLLVHALLLFCMSLYIFQLRDDNEAVSVTASESNELPFDFEELVALQLDSAGNDEETVLPQNQTLPFQSNPLLTSEAVDIAKYAGNGEGQEGDDSTGLMFEMPSGGKVVSAGSFSAWTVPKDPGPGEDYKIVIMIRVPTKQPLYRITDLSGEVIGTDGFRLEIPFGKFRDRYGTRIQRGSQLVFPRRNDRIRVVDGNVQIVVDIPGATRLVKDTIELKSQMLKEEQRLEIEF